MMEETLGADLPARRGRLRRIFFGPQGLRAGWGLLIFIAISQVLGAALGWTAQRVFHLPDNPPWTAELILGFETASLVVALAVIALMARLEARSLARYGFPLRQAFGALFGEGAAWGLGAICVLMLLMAAAGGYSVSGLALHGASLLRYALLWGLAFLMVGLYEELFFRSYPLFTVSRGVGFWPAALVLSLLFGALHYFVKPQETWMDGVSVTLIALFFCLSVQRTGSVWFAIGFHFTFNFGAMFVFGGPNTGNQGRPLTGHLLESSFRGPDWLTGGPMGPEASVFVFVVLLVLFLGLTRRFPVARWPEAEASRIVAA